MDNISLVGVRTHNLKNFDLQLPRDKLIVITGLSGSGKSSLAFDTLYAEGQRRYVESLSAYARQFLSMMEKPDVDSIEGLSPAISIEQKSTSHNPRSTVGTITEIHDYMRLLFARVGDPRCPQHGVTLAAQTVGQMVDQILTFPENERIMLLAPVVRDRKGEHLHLFSELIRDGFVRVRINGIVTELADVPPLDKMKKHSVEVVVDRLRPRQDARLRIAESVETALKVSDGLLFVAFMDEPERPDVIFSARYSCPLCDYNTPELEPRMFSFNNPSGACEECVGLGIKQYFDPGLVVRDDRLSLEEGAIGGWDQRSMYYYQLLASLAGHYGFSLATPFCELSQQHRDIILHGTGQEPIRFIRVNEQGRTFTRRKPFEGVLPNMERRYRDADSSMVREHLSRFLSMRPCPECAGTRLREASRHVFVDNIALPELTAISIEECAQRVGRMRFQGQNRMIAEKILREIQARLSFLNDVGLGYLTLARSAENLSGGEAQRIRLASQIGAGLVGVMYILDEPSIGLHQRDNARLLATLTHLRDIGNTVLVVEHDEEAIRTADQIVDMGPGAGVHGGRVVAQGSYQQIAACKESITGQFLSGKRSIPVPGRVPRNPHQQLLLKGATGNNLKNLTVAFPLGLMTCVTGVSGSGKSTLVNHTLYPAVAVQLHRSNLDIAPFASIAGVKHIDKVVDIDQSPIGRTPRSNPATYTGLFTPIRDLFAGTQEARSRSYKPGRFSFNVRGGRCEACQGDGLIKVEMHFLPDIYVTCDVCAGKRYNNETLSVKFKEKNIADVLAMTVEDALEFFRVHPSIARKLQTLEDVGLSYITLGQSATTLSGGEAQRVKLSKELSKRETGNTLYILDEPTTGLHFHDIDQLLRVLHRLRDQGNTIVVIEHNLDVIKTADWILDLGPEGGAGGGTMVVEGTPEEVAACPDSHTGKFLRPLLHEKTSRRRRSA